MKYEHLFIVYENEDGTYSVLPDPDIAQEVWEWENPKRGLERYYRVGMHGTSYATTRYTKMAARNVRDRLNRVYGHWDLRT